MWNRCNRWWKAGIWKGFSSLNFSVLWYVNHAKIAIIVIFFFSLQTLGTANGIAFLAPLSHASKFDRQLLTYYMRDPWFFFVTHTHSKVQSIRNPELCTFHNFMRYILRSNIETTHLTERIWWISASSCGHNRVDIYHINQKEKEKISDIYYLYIILICYTSQTVDGREN